VTPRFDANGNMISHKDWPKIKDNVIVVGWQEDSREAR
jgi:hypothetical protein